MTWFKRRGGIKEPSQIVEQLRGDLKQVDALRLPIYLNEDRIPVVFEQWHTPVTEVLSSGEIRADISARYISFFGAGASTATSASEKIELTAISKVRLLEQAARARGRLVDLASAEPREGALLTFVGNGRLFLHDERVHEDESIGLSAESADAVQTEREKWEARQKEFEHPVGTYVWAASGRRPLASIVSTRRLDPGWLDSHGRPPFGILGLYGDEIGRVVLVTALWIWHAQEPARADSGRLGRIGAQQHVQEVVAQRLCGNRIHREGAPQSFRVTCGGR